MFSFLLLCCNSTANKKELTKEMLKNAKEKTQVLRLV